MRKLWTIFLFAGLCMVMLAGNAVCFKADDMASSGIIKITDFKAREIPMYKGPGGEIFDTLVFAKKSFDVHGQKIKAFEFYTKNDSLFLVYNVKLGWNAASQIANNRHYYSGEPVPSPWPGVPGPVYILEFAAALTPDGEWAKVLPYVSAADGMQNVDGAGLGQGFKPHAPFYIKYDPAYMAFTLWEEVIQKVYVFCFNPQTVIYDAPDGKPVEKPFEVYCGFAGGKPVGDWLPAFFFTDSYEAYDKNFSGWIKWRDERGLAISPSDMHIGPPLI